jgi:hypothetical protein
LCTNFLLIIIVCSDVTVFGTGTKKDFIFTEEASLIQINQPYLLKFGDDCDGIFFYKIEVIFCLALTYYHISSIEVLQT